jgi:hypothetical protein
MRFSIFPALLLLCCKCVFAQQGIDEPKRIPPIGIAVNDTDRRELETGLKRLEKEIDNLKLKQDAFITDLLPDAEIYYKAVDYALKHQEFFAEKEIASAKTLLKEGLSRAEALNRHEAYWATQKGEVVRGYRSKIDGSVQPYGLTVPENYSAAGQKFNLSLWFHGRGETLSEVNFIAGSKGFSNSMPTMKNTIMLYPYGRFCNAFKFAGEVDVLEAMESVKKHYHINENGLIDRGFSMGGAAAWHFAVHYPDWWLAANAGAGFADTFDFLQTFSKETLHPTWYERKLWHLYDCTDYASNLSNLPLFAYNGDKDVQKEAADIMEKAMKAEGLTLTRLTGLNTAHSYNKESARITDSLLSAVAAAGKRLAPKELHFTTYTLKYNQMYWLRVDALKQHWERARVDGWIEGNTINLKTTNVTGLSLDKNILSGLIASSKPIVLNIDSTVISLKTTGKALPGFHRENGKWLQGEAKTILAKRHNLQGPIDDAFMGAFIVVRPTGTSKNTMFDQWSKAELERFLVQWRREFRGDAIVKADTALRWEDYSSNLIVFGDKESNRFLAKVSTKLPIQWTSESIQAGKSSYSSKDHALIMICPNPVNTKKYLVLNSGFTFRENSYLNNSKQIPMLPDWAVVDLNIPPGPVYPGKIQDAGFFGEHWEFKK